MAAVSVAVDEPALAAAAGVDLRLDDDLAAELLGDGARLGGSRCDAASGTATPYFANSSLAWYS